MRNAAFVVLLLVSCDEETDTRPRAPVSQTFPVGSSGTGNGSTSASGTAGSGGEGGGGGTTATTGGSTSTVNPVTDLASICTCVWNVTHTAGSDACGLCRADVGLGPCSAVRAACEADAFCNVLVSNLLPGCMQDPPEFACIEDAFQGAPASLALARDVLVCYCNECGTECDADPQCQ